MLKDREIRALCKAQRPTSLEMLFWSAKKALLMGDDPTEVFDQLRRNRGDLFKPEEK